MRNPSPANQRGGEAPETPPQPTGGDLGEESPGRPQPLSTEGLGSDPLTAVRRWLEEAEGRSGQRNPNAATLSTVDTQGRPDGRTVLVKGVDARGLAFFTNYDSPKGRQLQAQPVAALTFYWDRMGRQVRVRGEVARTSGEESDAYFTSRPRVSRIGAWASDQSRELEGREILDARVVELERRFPGEEIPRPEHWGGYILRPDEVEFWQEGPFRLHDRIRFRRAATGWTAVRLFP